MCPSLCVFSLFMGSGSWFESKGHVFSVFWVVFEGYDPIRKFELFLLCPTRDPWESRHNYLQVPGCQKGCWSQNDNLMLCLMDIVGKWEKSTDTWLGGGNSTIFYVHPETLGKIANLTNIFQMGWNHQPDVVYHIPLWKSPNLNDSHGARGRSTPTCFPMVGMVVKVIRSGGGFKDLICSSLFGEMIQFDWYLSDGLKPPTSIVRVYKYIYISIIRLPVI